MLFTHVVLSTPECHSVFATPIQVVQLLDNAKIPALMGEEFICVRTHDAVVYCQELLAERDAELVAASGLGMVV